MDDVAKVIRLKQKMT